MKIKNIVFIVITAILIITSFTSFSYAADDIEDIITNMKDINSNSDYGNDSKVAKVINNGIYLLQVAGTGITLVVITILGIKYMVASVEEKAEVKKQAMPILIGCILLFGAVNIIWVVSTFADKALV